MILRPLRLHGLIARQTGSNSYALTSDGIRVVVFYTKLQARLLPLLEADKPPAPAELRPALATVERVMGSTFRTPALELPPETCHIIQRLVDQEELDSFDERSDGDVRPAQSAKVQQDGLRVLKLQEGCICSIGNSFEPERSQYPRNLSVWTQEWNVADSTQSSSTLSGVAVEIDLYPDCVDNVEAQIGLFDVGVVQQHIRVIDQLLRYARREGSGAKGRCHREVRFWEGHWCPAGRRERHGAHRRDLWRDLVRSASLSEDSCSVGNRCAPSECRNSTRFGRGGNAEPQSRL